MAAAVAAEITADDMSLPTAISAVVAAPGANALLMGFTDNSGMARECARIHRTRPLADHGNCDFTDD
jgi:hypothetical protein